MASLYKRGRVWYSKIRIDGKEVRQPLDTDKGIAEEKLGELIKQRNSAKYSNGAPTGSPIDAFWKKYSPFCEEQKSHSRFKDEKAAWEALRASRPNIQRLEEVQPHTLDALKTEWKKAGVSDDMIFRRVSCAKTIMRKAEDWNIVKAQRWASVKMSSPYDPSPLFWEVPSMVKILRKTIGLWKTAFAAGCRGGLRPGESFHLQPADLLLDLPAIKIQPKDCDCVPCKRDGGRWFPKTKKSYRTIPIPEDLAKHLRKLDLSHKWVLVDHRGKRPARMTYDFYPIRMLRSLGLPGSMQTARHTYASHLVQNGANLYWVRDLMGHKSIKHTEIYAKNAPVTLERAVALQPPASY